MEDEFEGAESGTTVADKDVAASGAEPEEEHAAAEEAGLADEAPVEEVDLSPEALTRTHQSLKALVEAVTDVSGWWAEALEAPPMQDLFRELYMGIESKRDEMENCKPAELLKLQGGIEARRAIIASIEAKGDDADAKAALQNLAEFETTHALFLQGLGKDNGDDQSEAATG